MNAFSYDLFAVQCVQSAMHFLWQGALIAVAVEVLIRLFFRNSPQGTYALAMGSMILMFLCMPFNLWWLNDSRALSANSNPPLANERLELTKAFNPPEFEAPSISREEPVFTTLEESDRVFLGDNAWRLQRLAPWLLNVYWAGMIFMFAKLLAGIYGGHRLKGCSTAVTQEFLIMPFDKLARQFHLRSKPVFALCDRLTGPVVVGLIQPVLLVPLSLMTQLTPTQIESVLAHELAHIRRRDPWFLLLQRIVESALFFHPAVWWVSRRVDGAREACCDGLALSCGLCKADYAEALVRLSELRNPSPLADTDTPRFQLAAHGNGKPSQLTTRIQHILGMDTQSPIRLSRAGFFVMMTGLSILGALPVARSISTVDGNSNPIESNSPLEALTTFNRIPSADEPGVYYDPFGKPYRISISPPNSDEDLSRTNLSLFAQLFPELALDEDPLTHELRFQPDLQSDRRTSWTALHKVDRQAGQTLYRMFSHVTWSGEFPVKMNEEPERFRVRMQSGGHHELNLEIRLPDMEPPLQTLKLSRDQPMEFQVDGKSYTMSYPTSHVAKDKPNVTDTATIILTYQPPEGYRAVRIHVANDKSIAFEGNTTTWDDLPYWFKRVEDRPELVLELAIESAEHVLVSELDHYQFNLGQLTNQYGFKYGSYVGEHSIKPKSESIPLIITVAKSGMIRINEETVPNSDLQLRLAEVVERNAGGSFEAIIRAEVEVPFQWIGGIIQLLKQSGIHKIKLQGEVEFSSEPPNRSTRSSSQDLRKSIAITTQQLVDDIRQRDDPIKRNKTLEFIRQGLKSGIDAQLPKDYFGDQGQMEVDKAIETLLSLLIQTSEIPFDRSPFLPLIHDCLNHDSAPVRANAVRVLPQLNTDHSDLNRVFELMERETEPVVKQEMAHALFALDPKAEDPRLHPTIATLLNDTNQDVVKRTVQSLWGHPVSPDVESILIDLSNTDSWEGDVIYFALSTRPVMRPPVCGRLIKALEHPNWNVSSRAAWGLSHHTLDPAAVDLVVEALIDTYDHSLNRHVRDNCLFGLKANPTPNAVAKLKMIAAEEENQSFRDKANEALKLLERN